MDKITIMWGDKWRELEANPELDYKVKWYMFGEFVKTKERELNEAWAKTHSEPTPSHLI